MFCGLLFGVVCSSSILENLLSGSSCILGSFSTSLRHSKWGELDNLDPEIERSLWKFCHAIKFKTTNKTIVIVDNTKEEEQNDPTLPPPMANHTMEDYAWLSIIGTQSRFDRPAVNENTFEIKPNIIQMVQNNIQFNRLPDEDPNAYIANILELCDTFKINGVLEDAIRLRLSPFSLRDKAKSWLIFLSAGSITNWKSLAEKFLR